MNPSLPPGNEVWNKVMFLQLFVSQQGGEGRGYDVTSCYRQHPLPPGQQPPPQHPQAIPPPDSTSPGQQAGGTHPTGMLSFREIQW